MAIVLRCMTLSKLCYLITVAFYPHADPFDSRSVRFVLHFLHLSHRSFQHKHGQKEEEEGRSLSSKVKRF